MTDALAVPAAGDEPDHLDGIEGYVTTDKGTHRLALLAEGVHCGGCVRKIEQALAVEPVVEEARLNLTTRRLHLAWRGPLGEARRLVDKVEALGFRLVPFDAERAEDDDAKERRALLRAMGIAGFAAANVMLLSVAVWAGHAYGMSDTTRTLLH